MAISKFRGKGQIPWLSLKFRGPRKTLGPNDKLQVHGNKCTPVQYNLALH